MSKVDVKQLLEAGAHFGHRTSRRHPMMDKYIHSSRGDTHIIDLIQTAELLDEALGFITEQVGKGKQVLLVGTKRQAKSIVKKAAEDSGMPAVYNRWLGGMLTNSKTMKSRIKHLKDLEEKMESGELEQRYNKLEVQRFQEEIDKLNDSFFGIKDMAGKPGVVFVTDIMSDDLAVKEAKRLNIPVVAIVDTNADPSEVDYPIPANDDAIKSLQLITDYMVQAINEGKKQAKVAPVKKPTKAKPNAKKTGTKKEESGVAKKDEAASKESAPKKKTAKKSTTKKTSSKKATSKKTTKKNEGKK